MTTERTRSPNHELEGQGYGDFQIVRHVGEGRYLLRCKKCNHEIERDGMSIKYKKATPICQKCKPRPVLSNTETKVAELVAQGMINKHIARQMSISDRTVQAYLQNIYGKLGINNRSQLVAYIVEGRKLQQRRTVATNGATGK